MLLLVLFGLMPAVLTSRVVLRNDGRPVILHDSLDQLYKGLFGPLRDLKLDNAEVVTQRLVHNPFTTPKAPIEPKTKVSDSLPDPGKGLPKGQLPRSSSSSSESVSNDKEQDRSVESKASPWKPKPFHLNLKNSFETIQTNKTKRSKARKSMEKLLAEFDLKNLENESQRSSPEVTMKKMTKSEEKHFNPWKWSHSKERRPIHRGSPVNVKHIIPNPKKKPQSQDQFVEYLFKSV